MALSMNVNKYVTVLNISQFAVLTFSEQFTVSYNT